MALLLGIEIVLSNSSLQSIVLVFSEEDRPNNDAIVGILKEETM